MNTNFIKMIMHFMNYFLLIMLFYSVFTSNLLLSGVTASAYWFVLLLAIFFGPLIYNLSYVARYSKDSNSRNKAAELVLGAAKKRNILRVVLGWGELITISSLLAHSGWIFTSICYVCSYLWLHLFISMARENLATLEIMEV